MPHFSSEKHVMVSNNVEKAIKSILENSNVIEDYIENNNLAKPGDQAKPSSGLNTNELASLIKCDQQFVKKVSSIVAEMLLQSSDFKQSMFESLTMEYQGSINSLQNRLENLEKEKKNLYAQIEEQQQYSRRNCLVIHGIQPVPNNTKENTDEAVQRFIQEHLKITVQDKDIHRSHRLGNKSGPIIVKFCRHNLKQEIYFSKKQLKNKNYLITESLTTARIEAMNLLKQLKAQRKINSFWTIDDRIFYTVKSNPENKCIINPLNLTVLMDL